MTTQSGYAVGGGTATGSTAAPDAKPNGYWSLSKCRKAYLDYLGNKQEEIDEQKNARRYYHGAQWTAEQLAVLKKRRQPVSTRNRIGRKIDGVVGLIERLRQDPKAYPRTPKHEEGAELATAVIRYVLDDQEWKAKSPEVARDGAIDGIAGIELELVEDDNSDYRISFNIIKPDSFFYDPRSYRADFTDARYMGVGKWLDLDTAKEMFPDKADQIDATTGNDSDLSSNPDRENKWFTFDGTKKLVRVVDLWYQHGGKWCYSLFTGSLTLSEGESYLFDENDKTICKFLMFSCNVDHDGDRYGFIRNMRSMQDSLNFKDSKLNFMLASNKIVVSAGAVQDIEGARREEARSDGVVVVNGNVNDVYKKEDKDFDFAGWSKMMEESKQELDNFGPNPALIGDITNQSGRAIQLLQQAGMAELGPYILAYRGWKIRVYRAIFSAVQRYWTGERWIRVTDDDGIAQFIQINGTQIDPMTGHPVMVNALGQLDVDIIMDEGPDTINAQQDIYETLSNVLPTVAPMLNPIEAKAAVKVLIDSSALPASAKKQFRDASMKAEQMPPPPNPEEMKIKAKQAENAVNLQFEAAKFNQDMQFKEKEAAANMAFKAQEAEFDRALQLQKQQDDMEIEVFKARTQVDTERMKLGAHVEGEREKSGIHRETERAKLDMQREAHEQKLHSEKAIKTESRRDPSTEKLAEAVAKMGEKIGEGMTAMAGSIAEMGEAIAAPKQVVRDSKGNIIGAKPVEKLRA